MLFFLYERKEAGSTGWGASSQKPGLLFGPFFFFFCVGPLLLYFAASDVCWEHWSFGRTATAQVVLWWYDRSEGVVVAE